MRRKTHGLPNGLSHQLLQWIADKVALDDPIRIQSLEHHKFIQVLGNGRFGDVSFKPSCIMFCLPGSEIC